MVTRKKPISRGPTARSARGTSRRRVCFAPSPRRRSQGHRAPSRTLRELGSETADLRSSSDAFAAAVEILHRNPYDIPFALLYRTDAEGKRATLSGVAGVEKTSGTPIDIGVDPESNPWGLDLCSQEVQVVTNLEKFFTEIPDHAGQHPPSRPSSCPSLKDLRTKPQAMVAGISSYRRLDDDYRGFLTLVASHIATAVSNSRAYHRPDTPRASTWRRSIARRPPSSPMSATNSGLR